MKVGPLMKTTATAMLLSAALGLANAQEAPVLNSASSENVSLQEVGANAKAASQKACANDTAKSIVKGVIGFLGAGPLAGKVVDGACNIAQKPSNADAAVDAPTVASNALPSAQGMTGSALPAPSVSAIGDGVKSGIEGIGKSLGGFFGKLNERRMANQEQPTPNAPSSGGPGM